MTFRRIVTEVCFLARAPIEPNQLMSNKSQKYFMSYQPV